ncbi:MAG: hypothetical protein U9Q27_00440 [Patescibacteria group bacterium]|nr:hypothetical protein [Patescibacteria group bacterium]
MSQKTIFILILILFAVLLSANFTFAKEKCTVNPEIKTGYPNIEQDKIPIGEAVDESELLAQKLIDEMENIIDEEIPNMENVVTGLLPLPDLCECAATPVLDTTCKAEDTSMDTHPCAGCKPEYCPECKSKYYAECAGCECECMNCYNDAREYVCDYNYKEKCECTECDYSCDFTKINGDWECVASGTGKCNCGNCVDCGSGVSRECQKSGCECKCVAGCVSECKPKNPIYECKCKERIIYDDYPKENCDRAPCRNRAVRIICCGKKCHCNGCYCTTCNSGEVCPNDQITIRIKITDDYATCEEIAYAGTGFNPCYSIGNINLRITDSFNKIDNLIEVKNLVEGDPLIPDDPNRWKILNKLIDSREKFEQCITGYGFIKKQNKIQEQIFSCDMILREKYVNKTAILGYFGNDFPHCYPFTIETQKDDSKCKNGFTNQCFEEIIKMKLMDNYFCCKGE